MLRELVSDLLEAKDCSTFMKERNNETDHVG